MIHLLLQYFGGRGSSGKSGGGYAVTARSGHMFMDRYDYSYERGRITRYEERADMVKQTVPQYSEEKAEELVEHMDLWSGGGYKSVREAQQQAIEGKSYDKEWFASGELLEDYISKAPKYNGEMYRGLNLNKKESKEIINHLKNGDSIDMLGTSSWTSRESVANELIQGSGIQFRVSKTNKGTSIQHLSAYGKKEAEILVSKTARYKAKSIDIFNIDKYRTMYFVELEEL